MAEVPGGGSGIAMGVRTPAPANPMALAESFAEIQNKLNQAKLFKEEFAAKQRFGEIMASAPDLDTAIVEAYKDPSVSGFALPLIQQATGTRNVIIDNMGKLAGQRKDAFGQFLSNVVNLAQDPSDGNWAAAKGTSLELATPESRSSLRTNMDHFQKAMNFGLSDDPETRQNQIVQRFTGWATAAGIGDKMGLILGAPAEVDMGGRTEFGLRAPVQGGPEWLGGQAPGSFLPGNALMKNRAPGVYEPGGVEMGPGPIGGPGSGGVSGNQLGAGPGPGMAGGPAGGPGPAAIPDPGPSALRAGDGTPLMPADLSRWLPKPSAGYIGGKSTSELEQVKRLGDRFTTDDRDEYRAAQAASAMLREMEVGYDVLNAEGGFQSTGAGGRLRNDVARLVTTVEQMVGSDKYSFDPYKTSTAEQFNKNVTRLGFALVNNSFGAQREAATVIMNAIEAVPGLSNTYLGGKMLVNSLQSTSKRAQDEYEFKQIWANQRDGDLRGADTAFQEAHPAELYKEQMMARFGLPQGGWKTLAELQEAVKQGLVSETDAEVLARAGKLK